jgi:hypothetical protein
MWYTYHIIIQEGTDMPELYQLAARRREIVEEIDAIKRMKKGTLNSLYNKVTNKKGEDVLNGPYYVLSKKGVGNKTVSERIPATDAPKVQEDVDNYKRFKQLTDEYIDVCERLSEFADAEDEGKKN